MQIVIDTNRIIAALIRNGASRAILFNKKFKFFTPDYSLYEVRNHEDEIREKTEISHGEFEILLSILFEKIKIIPKEEYDYNISQAKKLIVDKDAPFLALAMAMNADAIWSDDKHFQSQNKVRVLTTKDIISNF